MSYAPVCGRGFNFKESKMAKRKHPAVRIREFADKSHAAKDKKGKIIKTGGVRR